MLAKHVRIDATYFGGSVRQENRPGGGGGHVTRTEFMLGSARNAAMDALLDQAFFKLGASQWDAFVAALDAPPNENPRLKRLLARKAPWEK